MYELDPKKEYTQTKFDADLAGRRADQEDNNASRSRYMQGYAKGGIVGPNRLKWGSPKVSAPCADTKTLKCIT
jgi:hypothetical protein